MRRAATGALIAVALLGALVPAVFVVREAGGLSAWTGVMPRGTTDSLYYYARIREVADGHPFVGNPYAYEHRDALPPAAFIPDMLTALPVVAGVPFDLAMVANVFAWSLIFLVLAYLLLRRLALPPVWAVGWAVLSYASAYSFMLRPTVMQVTYPVFLLFLIALLAFLKAPRRRTALLLAGAAALAFYTYTFLAYVALIALAALLIFSLARRRLEEFKYLMVAAGASLVLLVPFALYSLLQLRDPHYLATITRIGLVHTRIPAIEAYYYGRWILAGVLAFLLLGRSLRSAADHVPARHLLWIISGAGLLGALMLNVATGAELTLAVHIGRIAIPWLPLALGAGVYAWWQARAPQLRFSHLIAGMLLLVLAVGTATGARRGLDFFGFNARGQTVAEVQAYAAPLAWLQANVPQESVVWSNNSLAQHLAVLTRHYPLFFEGVALHVVSDREVEERYLLAHSLAPLSAADLKRDMGLYTGAGAAKLQPLAQNQRADLCRLVVRIAPRDCPPRTSGVALRGEAYFEDLARRFTDVRRDRDTLLAQYHVAYLLVDRQKDAAWRVPSSWPVVYDDGRFEIRKLDLD